MDSGRIIEISNEILNIFNREEMSRFDSMFALEATISMIHEQSLKELIKFELSKKVEPNYPGIH